jgi:hypothetical protein
MLLRSARTSPYPLDHTNGSDQLHMTSIFHYDDGCGLTARGSTAVQPVPSHHWYAVGNMVVLEICALLNIKPES